MNQNQSYRFINMIPFYFLIIFLSGLQGETIRPQEKNKKEILTINNKKRTYYQLHKEPLTYKLSGPKRVEIIARGVVPRKETNEVQFSYYLIMDTGDSIFINHNGVKTKSITSAQHPGHGFTHPGKYFINITKGNHWFTIKPISEKHLPLVVRVRVKEFESENDDRKFVKVLGGINPSHLVTGEKSIRYYKLIHGDKLQFEPKNLSKIILLSRLGFQNGMSDYEQYQIRILKDEKIVGTYFFSSEKSENSTIKENKKVIPGKWRSCEINLTKKKHTYSVELLDKGKTVYIRCLGIK